MRNRLFSAKAMRWAVMVAVFLAGTAKAAVAVHTSPIVCDTKYFDPAHPPKNMPHLGIGEAALTWGAFGCQVRTTSEPVSREPTANGISATVLITSVTISTQLHVTIWLPKGANAKLTAHEEGHRKINQRIYNDHAAAAAREAGALIDGKQFSGDGTDARMASKKALEVGIARVGERYMKLIGSYAEDVNNAYDNLTSHGTNDKSEADAIHEAFEKCQQEGPATGPSRKE